MKRIFAKAIVVAAVAASLAAPTWAQSRGRGGSRGGAGMVFRAGPSSGVPGLGFDYANLAAISRSMPIQLMREPSGGFITPIISWGLPFYSEPQPTIIVVQQPPPTIVYAPASPPAPAGEAPAPASRNAAPEQPQAPPREVGQLILVRRDGQIVLAIAFSTVGDRLTYIAQDGTRRSFLVAELDIETTRQMNDANGMTLNLPH